MSEARPGNNLALQTCNSARVGREVSMTTPVDHGDQNVILVTGASGFTDNDDERAALQYALLRLQAAPEKKNPA
jgi:hypothetical protein